MAYTERALALATANQTTSCIKCECLGEFMADSGEFFIMTGATLPLDKDALTSERTCHCATCYRNGGCETLDDRTMRICMNQVECSLLKQPFEPATAADKEIQELTANSFRDGYGDGSVNWENPRVKFIIQTADDALKAMVAEILSAVWPIV